VHTTLKRVKCIVCRVPSAKVVGSTSSEGFLVVAGIDDDDGDAGVEVREGDGAEN